MRSVEARTHYAQSNRHSRILASLAESRGLPSGAHIRPRSAHIISIWKGTGLWWPRMEARKFTTHRAEGYAVRYREARKKPSGSELFAKEQLPEVERAITKTEFYLDLEMDLLKRLAAESPSFGQAKRAWLNNLGPQVDAWYREHVLGDKDSVVSPMKYKRYRDGAIMLWYEDPKTGIIRIDRLSQIMTGERQGNDKIAAEKLERELTDNGIYVWVSPAGDCYPNHQLYIGKVEKSNKFQRYGDTIRALAIKVDKRVSNSTIIRFLNRLAQQAGSAARLREDASVEQILGHPVIFKAEAGDDSFAKLVHILEDVVYGEIDVARQERKIFENTTFDYLYDLLETPELWRIRAEINPHLIKYGEEILATDDTEEIRLYLAQMLYYIVDAEVKKLETLQPPRFFASTSGVDRSSLTIQRDSLSFYSMDGFDRNLAFMETREGACGLPANTRTGPKREHPEMPKIGEAGQSIEGMPEEDGMPCPDCNMMIDPCGDECPYCGLKSPTTTATKLSATPVKMTKSQKKQESLDILRKALARIISSKKRGREAAIQAS